jgi:hypothetical protein
VEHLASHRRLAYEGAGSTWTKANLSGAANTQVGSIHRTS